jgi:hypothetical protein
MNGKLHALLEFSRQEGLAADLGFVVRLPL